MTALITATDLSKVYRIRKKGSNAIRTFFRPEVTAIEALRHVSFQIEEGELVGYIGPNGAGKSTTVKILSGILTPDSGSCCVLGHSPTHNRIQVVSRIGVVFGQRSQLWWDLPVIDSFALLRDIYRIPAGAYQKSLDELTGRLSLEPLLATPVRQLSLGQRMRCELAASLLHEPRVLFLDEPTIGLDAVSKLAIRDFIRQRNRESGMTAILTTHDMDDVESLCSRVLLIGNGRILMDGSVSDLLSTQHERRIIATLARPPEGAWLPDGVRVERQKGNDWLFIFDPEQVPAAMLISLISSHCGIADLIVKNPPIDEVVAAQYARFAEAQP